MDRLWIIQGAAADLTIKALADPTPREHTLSDEQNTLLLESFTGNAGLFCRLTSALPAALVCPQNGSSDQRVGVSVGIV